VPEAERLIRLADEAMYASKRSGRDRVTSVTA
jgi:PleD family two-component response regulator